MEDTPQTGQTRTKPGSGSSSPIGKKPRLETPSEATAIGRITDRLVTGTTAKKSAKKEARKAKKKGLHVLPEPYSTEDVLWRDVASVLGQDVVDEAVDEGTEWESPFGSKEEVELMVHSLSSNGMRSRQTTQDLRLIYIVEILRRRPGPCTRPSE
jgi:tRNA (uracil-5-)-methyltransferase